MDPSGILASNSSAMLDSDNGGRDARLNLNLTKAMETGQIVIYIKYDSVLPP